MATEESKTRKPVNRPISQRRSGPVVALGLPGNAWIHEEARHRGWRLFNLNYCGGSIPDGLEFSGAILTRYAEDPWVKALSERNYPTVYVSSTEAQSNQLQPSVTPDMFAEGQLAAEHFANRSFRQLAFFGRQPWSEAKRLWEGFNSRAGELGMEVSLFRTGVVKGENHRTRDERRQREFTEWIAGLQKPVGLLAPGAQIAALYCNWAALAGFDVPGDVAILSRGNRDAVCETFLPSISYLEIDEEGQINIACDLLTRMMAGERVCKQPIYTKPKGVVVHESTDLLATPDKEVAATLRYMWDNLNEELTVEDAARDLNISSRHLARKFRKTLDRTFRQELRRKRLEETQSLLKSTDYKLATIASMVGFQSTSYLHRAFQKAFGMTPNAYRKKSDD